MNEIRTSNRTIPTIHQYFAPVLIALFIFGSAFTPSDRVPSKAENAEMMQMRDYITGYAHNFLGLRYRHGGVTPKTGFDCSGFTSFLLKEFDIKVSSCSATQSKQGMKIPLKSVLPGDLVFFGKGRHIQHVAMVVDRTEEGVFVIHSTCSRGIIVENINTSKYWKPKILFARDVISQQWSQLASQ
jgi:cell wall-associated NlpC family hydrolase